MFLSKYFTESEFCHSITANKLGINNSWKDDQHRVNAIELCSAFLDVVREKLGQPLLISSGYRVRELNERIGGSSTSDHMNGLAADLTLIEKTPKAFNLLFNTIIHLAEQQKIPMFDQLIYGSGYIHIGIGERARGEIFDSGGIVHQLKVKSRMNSKDWGEIKEKLNILISDVNIIRQRIDKILD